MIERKISELFYTDRINNTMDKYAKQFHNMLAINSCAPTFNTIAENRSNFTQPGQRIPMPFELRSPFRPDREHSFVKLVLGVLFAEAAKKCPSISINDPDILNKYLTIIDNRLNRGIELYSLVIAPGTNQESFDKAMDLTLENDQSSFVFCDQLPQNVMLVVPNHSFHVGSIWMAKGRKRFGAGLAIDNILALKLN